MIKELTLTNFLSFRGPSTVELKPLNILIGGNGVGKSNFIRAIEVLQSLPTDVGAPIRRMGGAREVSWRGSVLKGREGSFEIDSLFRLQRSPFTMPIYLPEMLRYKVKVVSDTHQAHWIQEESLRAEGNDVAADDSARFIEKDGNDVRVMLASSERGDIGRGTKELIMQSHDLSQSILRQVKGPQVRQAMADLVTALEQIRLYDRWDTSRNSPMRRPESTSRIPNELLPDGSNLALVFSHLESRNVTFRVEEEMKRFNPRIRRIATSPQGNSIQLIFSENSLSSAVSASSVSDGTLQYLALLCVLLHPEPAPLVCFEEPECGLHPDAIPMLAQVLRDVSQRMQIIVSTHSDRLVDCFSDMPECVLVADRDEETNETVFERLDADELKVWLEKYRLGKLWTSGQIGGVIR